MNYLKSIGYDPNWKSWRKYFFWLHFVFSLISMTAFGYRTESRYSHRRMEYPLPDNENWLKFINWQKNKENEDELSFEKPA